MPENAAFYVDAFNLYYGINELGKPHLKWLNLFSLCTSLIPQESETLIRIVYCTAYKKHDFGKLARHQKYVKALQATGIECVFGHPIVEPMHCNSCSHAWDIEREKETDVNIALRLVLDGIDNVYHHAYLVTADSDQAATAAAIKKRCPHLKLTAVAPPNRNFSTHILKYTNRKIALTEEMISRHLFPQYIFKGGQFVVARPQEYDPPRIP
jgi:hypothetical protein